METKLKELRRLIEILPTLKRDMDYAEITYLREDNDDYGHWEDGFVYHVRPQVSENFICSKKAYKDADKRRWELIQELGLPCSVDGIPDFGDSPIKPYGLSDEEKYRMERMLNPNSPIDRI